MLDNQLKTYIIYMRRSVAFASLKEISDFLKNMLVEIKNISYICQSTSF